MVVDTGRVSLTRQSVVRAVAGLFTTLVAIAWVGAPAGAHSQLTGAEPEEGATVVAPKEVVLTFNEELLQLGTTLTLTDATGHVSELTPGYPEPHVVAAELADLPPGPTTVTWRVVSADGHPIEGVLTFEVAPPALQPAVSAPSSPTPDDSDPATASAPASPPPTPTTVPMPEQSGGVPWWLWAALAAAIASATGIAVWSARKR